MVVRADLWRRTACLIPLVLALAACGGATTSNSASGGGGASSFKVAVVTNEPTTDWAYAQDAGEAAQKIHSTLGVTTTLSENVPLPSAEDVFRRFANQHYNLIVAWGGQFTTPMQAVAQEFPSVKFMIVNGTVGNGTNLTSVDFYQNEWAFLQGYVMARLSKSGTVGFIGGQCFPSTAEDTNGVEEGAKYANKSINFLATWTGSFTDATAAQQATQAQIQRGADVIGQNTSALPGILSAAQGSHIPIVSVYFIPKNLGEGEIVAAVNEDQSRFVINVIKQIQSGTFIAKAIKEHLPADWGPVVISTPQLPASIYQDSLKVQDQITSGQLQVPDDTTCH